MKLLRMKDYRHRFYRFWNNRRCLTVDQKRAWALNWHPDSFHHVANYFFPDFTFAHLALAAALMLARPAALILRSFLAGFNSTATSGFDPKSFASFFSRPSIRSLSLAAW
jgi:hypothetical protein